MRDLLLAEIRAFVPADDAEEAHRHAVLSLIESDNFASRDRYRPGHITASAFIVDPVAHRVLLHHHRRLGKWLQMGGHLEPEETPAAAAVREGHEESGLPDLHLIVPGFIDLDVHEIPSSKSEPAHRHFDLRYLLATADPYAIQLADEESISLGWFGFDEAIELMAEPCSERAIRKIGEILARIAR